MTDEELIEDVCRNWNKDRRWVLGEALARLGLYSPDNATTLAEQYERTMELPRVVRRQLEVMNGC